MRVLENIIEARLPSGHNVRCWMHRSPEGPTPLQHYKCLQEIIETASISDEDTLRLAEFVEKQMIEKGFGVNAVEVRGARGGSIVYPSWP